MSINTVSSFKNSASEIRNAIGQEFEPLAAFLDEFAQSCDQTRLAEIEETYISVDPAELSDPQFLTSDHPERFLMMVSWFVQKYRVLQSLAMHDRSGCRILDMGCGAGHFLALAHYLGHSGIGIDQEDQFFAEMCALLGVERKEHEIKADTALPQLGEFDLITAQNVSFNLIEDRHWNEGEWIAFLKDVSDNLLAENGRLLLQFRDKSVKEEGLRIEDKSLPRFMRQIGALFVADDSGLEVTHFAMFNDAAKLRQKLTMFA